jgi:hypothetical protein
MKIVLYRRIAENYGVAIDQKIAKLIGLRPGDQVLVEPCLDYEGRPALLIRPLGRPPQPIRTAGEEGGESKESEVPS